MDLLDGHGGGSGGVSVREVEEVGGDPSKRGARSGVRSRGRRRAAEEQETPTGEGEAGSGGGGADGGGGGQGGEAHGGRERFPV